MARANYNVRMDFLDSPRMLVIVGRCSDKVLTLGEEYNPIRHPKLEKKGVGEKSFRGGEVMN